MSELEFEKLVKLAISNDPDSIELVKTLLEGMGWSERQFFNRWGLPQFKIYNFENLQTSLKNGINAYKSKVENLSPLKYFSNLKQLHLIDNPLVSLSSLPFLPELETLDVGRNPLTSLDGIEQAANLNALFAIGSKLEDIKAIAHLKQLYRANFYQTNISDFSPLRACPRLKELVISKCQKVDLSTLNNLTIKELYYEEIKDFYTHKLPDLPLLENLNLSNNYISKVENLGKYKLLRSLSLSSNFIHDLSGVSELDNLKYLHIGYCEIEYLNGLESNSIVFINLSNNQVRDLSPLKKVKQLDSLRITNNLHQLDLSPLYDCPNLTYLTINNCDPAQMAEFKRKKPNCTVELVNNH